MRNGSYKIFFVEITVMLMLGCKEVYNPPAIAAENQYLVVDGSIVNGDDSTIIILSRTRNLADTGSKFPELGAQVMVLGETSGVFSLQEMGDGKYAIDQLNLNTGEQCQLKIIRSNGKEYLSETISIKQTPAIDSISWKLDTGGVWIYVNTHDPLNNTWYYRWNFTDVWRYHTCFETIFDVQGGELINRTQPYIYRCYSSKNSTDILVGSSIKLSQDVIYQYPIQYIHFGDERISSRYSTLVRQFAISPNTYNYWQNLKKNTEQLGTLFDAQPSQLVGNIHCTSSPNEPVLGYVDGSTLETKRILVTDESVIGRRYLPYYYDKGCATFVKSIDSVFAYFPDTGPREWVFIGTTSPPGGFIYTTIYCGDCRYHGGTNIKPDFFP